MTFSINLPSVFNSIIGQKNLKKSYNDLFSFRMIIDVKVLKWEDQCPKLIQTLMMLIIGFKQNLTLINLLKSFHEILSSLGADKLLYLLIILLNSSFKKGVHSETGLDRILSKISVLTW